MAHKETYTGVAPVLALARGLALVRAFAVAVDAGVAVPYSLFQSVAFCFDQKTSFRSTYSVLLLFNSYGISVQHEPTALPLTAYCMGWSARKLHSMLLCGWVAPVVRLQYYAVLIINILRTTTVSHLQYSIPVLGISSGPASVL